MTTQIQFRINRLQKMLDSKRQRSSIERFCIQRQIDDLQNGEERGLIWDEREARNAVRFFLLLKHWEGEWAGKKINLAPWQKELIIASLFGWKKQDGTRRFSESFVLVPRKNGKSTIAAGIGLKMLTGDRESGAQIFCAATKKEQAKIVFTDAKMISKSSELASHLQYFRNSIYCPHWNSCFMPLSSDHDKMDGLNVACGICDEIQEHPSREIHDKLKTGMGSRRQPLLCSIGTAGHEKETIAGILYDSAVAISQNIYQDDAFHFFISEAEKDDDWAEPDIWLKANPNLGISLSESFIRNQCGDAKKRPSFQNNFRRLHLNQWTSSSTRWLDYNDWLACASPIELNGLNGCPCFGGLDLSTTIDLTAFALAFKSPDGKVTLFAWFWIPQERMRERELRDRVPYSLWVREGFIRETPGNVIDYDTIENDISELSKRFEI